MMPFRKYSFLCSSMNSVIPEMSNILPNPKVMRFTIAIARTINNITISMVGSRLYVFARKLFINDVSFMKLTWRYAKETSIVAISMRYLKSLTSRTFPMFMTSFLFATANMSWLPSLAIR